MGRVFQTKTFKIHNTITNYILGNIINIKITFITSNA